MKNKLTILIALIFLSSCSVSRKCGFKISEKDFNASINLINKNIEIIDSLDFQKELIIPVVFHVSYKDGEKRIPVELLEKEIKELNNDFQNKNDQSDLPSEFKNLIGNPKIRFEIAKIDENNNPTNGVIYFKTKRRRFNFRRPIFLANKIWNSKRFLNIYIGNIRGGKTKGYVNSYPWKRKSTDAIALHHTHIGKSTRLLTHETGHWFGLWHITEGGCSDKNDGISDTPKQKNFSKKCPIDKNECGNNCLVMNFMDYSDCRNMFTKGQVEKIHYIIKEKRPELITTANTVHN